MNEMSSSGNHEIPAPEGGKGYNELYGDDEQYLMSPEAVAAIDGAADEEETAVDLDATRDTTGQEEDPEDHV